MKFKKGDMVRVIKRQNPWGWNPIMQEMLDNGSCHPVGAVQTGGAEIVVYHGDDGFSFPHSSLEHAEKKREWPADWADSRGSDLDFLGSDDYKNMSQAEALEQAIGDLEQSISCMDSKNYGPQISAHETAMEQMQEVLDGLEQEQSMSQYEWTEQDYRECCGVWGLENGTGRSMLVDPGRLHTFCNRDSFEESVDGLVRVEPMPEQCIPVTAKPSWTSDAVSRYPRQTEWD